MWIFILNVHNMYVRTYIKITFFFEMLKHKKLWKHYKIVIICTSFSLKCHLQFISTGTRDHRESIFNFSRIPDTHVLLLVYCIMISSNRSLTSLNEFKYCCAWNKCEKHFFSPFLWNQNHKKSERAIHKKIKSFIFIQIMLIHNNWNVLCV